MSELIKVFAIHSVDRTDGKPYALALSEDECSLTITCVAELSGRPRSDYWVEVAWADLVSESGVRLSVKLEDANEEISEHEHRERALAEELRLSEGQVDTYKYEVEGLKIERNHLLAERDALRAEVALWKHRYGKLQNEKDAEQGKTETS